jgi:hypothetical protein
MGSLNAGKRKEARFLHLLDLKNMRVIFSKDAKGVRVEVCETKEGPPYVATLKFSFYVTEGEYRRIAKKHRTIISRMMEELEDLSETIEKMYRRKGKENGG